MWVKIRFEDLQALQQRIAKLEADVAAMPPHIKPGAVGMLDTELCTISTSKIANHAVTTDNIAPGHWDAALSALSAVAPQKPPHVHSSYCCRLSSIGDD